MQSYCAEFDEGMFPDIKSAKFKYTGRRRDGATVVLVRKYVEDTGSYNRSSQRKLVMYVLVGFGALVVLIRFVGDVFTSH